MRIQVSHLQQVAAAAGSHSRAAAHAAVSGVSCGIDALSKHTHVMISLQDPKSACEVSVCLIEDGPIYSSQRWQ